MDDALNPDAQINILAQSDSLQPPAQKITLQPGKTYSFKQTGAESATFNGSGLFVKNIDVRLPADFFVPESATFKMALDFSYGAGHGTGSVLNILVNDDIIHGFAIDNVNGNAFRDYLLSVPARYFRGGINKIAFHISQENQPAQGKCAHTSHSFLRFHLSNTSTLSIPQADHLSIQPDLRLLAGTGYPLARFTDQGPSLLYLTRPDMMSAALTLTGKLAQAAGTFIPDVAIAFGVPEQLTTNAIVLAKPADLNESLFSHVSASVAKVKKWPYRLQNELYNRVVKGSENPDRKTAATDFTLQESSLGSLATFIAMKNPATVKNGTLFIIAADSSKTLTQRVSQLVKSPLWSQLSGDFFVWQDAKKPLLVMQVSGRFNIGQARKWAELEAWVSNNPWYWLAGALLVVLLTSLIIYALIKRRYQKIKQAW
ncbi:cellulose biosynthesis cyclic di-GMP-binding regulatory protein BcsB [Vibrio quintilis]|uniref:Cyclic di-GMP-binding protein n=1 Tax=Vibrio quintilis TaxID=1117707 RepID=A0A1M7Z3C7_9VIBR|nr:cellulose biosynthesis cyclic di-GMP-binding regulatory protein BcsB [Vibrio quintilis]SHO59315.1 cellulose synthase regulator protein [Vibrio quintilis]